jgi:hypothetical protein
MGCLTEFYESFLIYLTKMCFKILKFPLRPSYFTPSNLLYSQFCVKNASKRLQNGSAINNYLLNLRVCICQMSPLTFHFAKCHACHQRQETLDLPYLTLLCDNLKNRMFLQNFFPHPILGIFYVFPVIHIIPLFHSQTISLGTVE